MILELLDSYEEELNNGLTEKNSRLDEIDVKIHETEKMIQMVQEENQGVFTEFTPRPIAEKNADKLDELSQTLDELKDKKTSCEEEIDFIEKRIKEVRQSRVEITSLPKNVPSKTSSVEDINVSRETSYSVLLDRDKLHLVLSYLPQDPMRAKIELENLLRR